MMFDFLAKPLQFVFSGCVFPLNAGKEELEIELAEAQAELQAQVACAAGEKAKVLADTRKEKQKLEIDVAEKQALNPPPEASCPVNRAVQL